MKNLIFASLAILILAGCSTPKTTGGVKRTFDAPYAVAFRAVTDACRMSSIRPKSIEPENGLIVAESQGNFDSWGEVVAVFVRPVSETKTEVEVISRREGPAEYFQHNWPQEILHNVETILAKK